MLLPWCLSENGAILLVGVRAPLSRSVACRALAELVVVLKFVQTTMVFRLCEITHDMYTRCLQWRCRDICRPAGCAHFWHASVLRDKNVIVIDLQE